jgi:phage terminase large subunit-like protein
MEDRKELRMSKKKKKVREMRMDNFMAKSLPIERESRHDHWSGGDSYEERKRSLTETRTTSKKKTVSHRRAEDGSSGE